MESNNRKAILHLHIAVMLFSFAGVVGQFVEVPSVMVAMGRVICSSILLFIIAKVKRDSLKLDSKKDYIAIMATGAVLAIHWTTFFQSIQVSSVAIGTITFSTFPLFLTFLEPIFYHEKLKMKSVISAIILLIGVAITIPEFSMENQVTIGIVWGMISSLTYAIITLANRYFSKKYEGRIVSFYEQGTAAIVLLPAIFLVPTVWRTQDILEYLQLTKIRYCSLYGDIISTDKGLKFSGYQRTGCAGCLFGCHLDQEPNRIQMLKITHPQIYNYLFDRLDYATVCDYIKIPY